MTSKIKALSKKQKNKLLFGEIFFICILSFALIYLQSFKNWDAQKIIREMIALNPAIDLVSDNQNLSQDFTPQGLCNVAYFNDSLVTIDENHPFAGCVEVYENHQYALLRKDYIETLDKQRESLFRVEDFGRVIANEYQKLNEVLFVNGNVLLRLDSSYTTYQKDKLTKIFNEALKSDNQTEKNIPTSDVINKLKKENKELAVKKIEKLKEEKIKALESEIALLEEKINSDDIDQLLVIIDRSTQYTTIPVVSEAATSLAQKANGIITAFVEEVDLILDDAQNELSRDLVSQAEHKIQALKHDVFLAYKEPWSTRINQINWLITEYEIKQYKSECAYYPYNEVLASPDDYVGLKAYFRGTIVEIQQTSTNAVLRLNVTPIYSYFTDTILYWNDSVYVDMPEGINLHVSEGDLVEIWGTLQGTATHNTFFGGEQTVLRFNCKYID